MKVYDPQIHGTPKLILDNPSDQVLTEAFGFYSNEGLSFVGKKNKDSRKKLTGKVRNKLDKIKDKVEDGVKKVGKIVAKAAVAVPRVSFLGLIRLNFRGFATKIYYANPEGQAKFNKFWEKIGGDDDSLRKALEAGYNKKPKACGKKCRLKASQSKENDPKTAIEKVQFMNVTGVEDAAALMASASPILASASAIVLAIKPTKEGEKAVKEVDEDLKKEDAAASAEDRGMTKEERKEAEAVIKQDEAAADPITQIENSSEIKPDEKEAAIADLKKTLKSGSGDSFFKKPTFWIVVGVVAIGGFILYKKRSQSSI